MFAAGWRLKKSHPGGASETKLYFLLALGKMKDIKKTKALSFLHYTSSIYYSFPKKFRCSLILQGIESTLVRGYLAELSTIKRGFPEKVCFCHGPLAMLNNIFWSRTASFVELFINYIIWEFLLFIHLFVILVFLLMLLLKISWLHYSILLCNSILVF